jgi:sec-independent protein translocase protein TatB
MFNVGTGEILVILLLALIVLGPDKLPETARKIGNVMGELRRMSHGFQSEIRSAFDEAINTDNAAPTKASTDHASAEHPSPDQPVTEASFEPAPIDATATDSQPDARSDDSAA